MDVIRDRLHGIAVGAAIGDALGMALEFQPPRPIFNLLTEMVDGGLPAGSFTDDTEMALALAESLLEHQPLDPQDLVERFGAWYASCPPDVGIHTSQVLEKILSGIRWNEAADLVQQQSPGDSSNGSLMRCWPVAIAYWQQPDELVRVSRLQSTVTHTHPDCVNACVLVNLVLRDLVTRSEGVPADEFLRESIASAVEQAGLDFGFKRMVELAPVRNRAELKNTGWVRHTVESAIWALLTTRSFEEALIQAVNLGHDADTTGSVAGALAGALYGFESIPQRWLDVLHGEYPLRSGKIWKTVDFMKLADDLARLTEQS